MTRCRFKAKQVYYIPLQNYCTPTILTWFIHSDFASTRLMSKLLWIWDHQQNQLKDLNVKIGWLPDNNKELFSRKPFFSQN